ncbi:MAG: hypothetical protein H8E57_00095 [Candidatus Cloacimonetes bacterium]|nr:hypothetical protein [Candidatus Cloacimonadota bacterium]
MVYIIYDLWYRIEWIKGGTSLGSLDYPTYDIKEVFDPLYQEVVVGSMLDPITDEINDSPENIRTIRITIRKKRVKA